MNREQPSVVLSQPKLKHSTVLIQSICGPVPWNANRGTTGHKYEVTQYANHFHCSEYNKWPVASNTVCPTFVTFNYAWTWLSSIILVRIWQVHGQNKVKKSAQVTTLKTQERNIWQLTVKEAKAHQGLQSWEGRTTLKKYVGPICSSYLKTDIELGSENMYICTFSRPTMGRVRRTFS
jgi:hypothetical protein